MVEPLVCRLRNGITLTVIAPPSVRLAEAAALFLADALKHFKGIKGSPFTDGSYGDRFRLGRVAFVFEMEGESTEVADWIKAAAFGYAAADALLQMIDQLPMFREWATDAGWVQVVVGHLDRPGGLPEALRLGLENDPENPAFE